MLEKFEQEIRTRGYHVFRLALVKDGVWEEVELFPASPCLNVYSISKNFTATAVGIAQDQGLLSLEDPILSYLEEDLPEKWDKKLSQVRIRHLLSHTMGNDEGYLFEGDRYTYTEKNWLKLILSRPLAFEPGQTFRYSNTNYYLLSCILHRVAGEDLLSFLRKNLLDPLDIVEYAWETCPRGETMGATGLYIAARDLVKLGLLYLQEGVWQGNRLFSAEWAAEATRQQAPDEAYGYGFWIKEDGFEMGGSHGQTVVVLPQKNLVMANQAYDDQMEALGPLLRSCLSF